MTKKKLFECGCGGVPVKKDSNREWVCAICSEREATRAPYAKSGVNESVRTKLKTQKDWEHPSEEFIPVLYPDAIARLESMLKGLDRIPS